MLLYSICPQSCLLFCLYACALCCLCLSACLSVSIHAPYDLSIFLHVCLLLKLTFAVSQHTYYIIHPLILRQVYAVECSNIVVQCRQIVKDNSLDDVIEVIQGKMEDIELDCEYVDVIISEWMGYFLLYESMLDTVLYARDKYLRPNTGIIMPDKAVLYITAIEDGEYKKDKIDFWDNVYVTDLYTCV